MGRDDRAGEKGHKFVGDAGRKSGVSFSATDSEVLVCPAILFEASRWFDAECYVGAINE